MGCSPIAMKNNKGLVLFSLKKYDKAIKGYDEAIMIKRDHHIAYYNKGNALSSLGKYDEAIKAYNEAIRIKRDHHSAFNNKGVALFSLGKYDEVIKAYDEAIRIKRDYHEAYHYKGYCYELLESYKDAEKYYKIALELEPHCESEPIDDVIKKAGFSINFYSWKQKAEAKKLNQLLTENDYTCWMDDSELEIGQKLFDEIAKGIYNSKMIIFCLSKDYIESPNCNREFHFALNQKKPYKPLIFAEDKRKEFGQWPPVSGIFFAISADLYDTELFKLLKNTPNFIENQTATKFIADIEKTLNELY